MNTHDDARRWERIEEVFDRALALPVGDRESFVKEACSGDAELERRVRALLEAEQGAAGFLETPIAHVDDPAALLVDSEARQEEGRIGPYRLVRPLGSGGMGDVFLGIQEGEGFKRYAAVKIAREGHGPGFTQRFTRERAILAQLAHPGIARFLGGGTTDDGRPYVAMEYVEGERLDHYCDRKGLAIRERLKLIRQICLAVQHAHGNLIVHRDLKPANILVTREGAPKLLDFGIAKLLSDDQPEVTRTGFRLATPEYAAPEQLRGDSVSTATDVYALGVVLYESLCGHRPRSSAEAVAAAIEPEPNPPPPPSQAVGRFSTRVLTDGEEETVTPEDVSAKRRADPQTLRRRLQGDLDNIVAKSLRFEPNERYVSAAALAEDIGLYLAGRPVRARPASVWYRTSKFLRRNRAASLVAGALAVTLVFATVSTLLQNRQISAQAERLEVERDRALAIQGFLLESFGAAGAESLAGDAVTVRQVLDGQAAQVEAQYADDANTRADMMHVLADGYERIGALESAELWARKSVEERRALAGERADPELARSATLLGWILSERYRLDESEALLREALAIWRRVPPDSTGLARTLNDLSGTLTRQGKFEEAETVAREALSIRRQLDPIPHRGIAITTNNLANILGGQGEHADALALLQEAAETLDELLGPGHRRTLRARANIAARYAWMGEWARSAEIGAAVIESYERMGSGPLLLAQALEVQGAALWFSGHRGEAHQALDRGLALAHEHLGDHHATAALLVQKAALRSQEREWAQGLASLREAIDIYARLYEDHPALASALRSQGALSGDREVRTRSYQEAAEMFARLEGDTGRNTVGATMDWARSLNAVGRYREALTCYSDLASTVPQAYGPVSAYAPVPYLGQAEALTGLGDLVGARTALREARSRLDGAGDAPANRAWIERIEEALAKAPAH